MDGLRGVGCVLVVLLHAWIVVPTDVLRSSGPLYGLFSSGSLGVTMFFVLGSFLVTRALLLEVGESGTVDRSRFWLRRFARLGPQLAVVLAVVYVIAVFDAADPWSSRQTERSLVSAATFTLNWSIVHDPLLHRADLGHLWYLSVEQQFYLGWVALVALLGRAQRTLISLTVVATCAVIAYRSHVLEADGPFAAQLRTFARADGLLLGGQAALALPYVRARRTLVTPIILPLALVLVGLVLLSPALDTYAFLGPQGIIFAFSFAAFVLALAISDGHVGWTRCGLNSWPLRKLGMVSYPIYLWHFPVFWASARWAGGVAWQVRAVGVFVVLAAIVYITHRWIEVPVRLLLTRAHRAPVLASHHPLAA